MKAMILAAGLGTRLRPLSLIRPKVLVPVMGTPVLDFWIERLHHAGFEAVVVNAFHLHEKLTAFIRDREWPIPVQVRVESVLLDTGGGIRNALDFFGETPFVVINGDILCNAPLSELYREYLDSGAPAGLLLHDCAPFNNVAVDRHGRILGFGREAHAPAQKNGIVRDLAFTGIHFMHPAILKDLQPGKPESILTVYRQLIREGNPPKALFTPDLFWREMGTVESYWTLNRELSRLPEQFLPPLRTGSTIHLHPEASIAPDVRFRGTVVVGKGARIPEGVQLEDVIVWDHASVERNSVLTGCIVTEGLRVCPFNHGTP